MIKFNWRWIIMDIHELEKKLTIQKKSVWSKRDIDSIEGYTSKYKKFIDYSKTERLAVKYSIKLLEDNGFKPLSYYEGIGKIDLGDKIYFVNREKSLFAIKYNHSMKNGINLVGAHIDSPRFDFKPEPLIEDENIAMAKTHYYGGVKKYHWFNIPLELHGVVVKSDGTKVEVSIGDDENDPIFVISDLLPHLDKELPNKKVSEAFDPEKMNLILGTISITYENDKKVNNPVKLNVLKILFEKYGIIEEDLVSAELEVVPALKARDVGLDRSLMASYGHDDRVCAYTALTGLIDSSSSLKNPAVLLVDKEEIGSDGNTGAKNHFWVNVIRKIMHLAKEEKVCSIIDDVISNSALLSADVSAAVDPNYKEAHDLSNAPRLGYGITLMKYTGSGGKSRTNDANAELLAKVRNLFNKEDISWQVGELGKVDRGGGGTIALFFAEKGLDVLDAGVPLLGMHSPYEIASKADIYETYLAYKTFFEKFGK
jgi:aspartyl aminopeptidase